MRAATRLQVPLTRIHRPELRITRERPLADPRTASSHRCANCQAPMPADVGTWLLSLRQEDKNTDRLVLLCSRECEEQFGEGRP